MITVLSSNGNFKDGEVTHNGGGGGGVRSINPGVFTTLQTIQSASSSIPIQFCILWYIMKEFYIFIIITIKTKIWKQIIHKVFS